MHPVKLMGVAHTEGYWSFALEPKIEALTSGTRRLGVELASSHLLALQSQLQHEFLTRFKARQMKKGRPWFRLPKQILPEHPMPPSMANFWLEILRFANKKGIEVVPLMSEHVYHVVGRTATSRGFGNGVVVPGRVMCPLQERSMAGRIRANRVDAAMMGGDHVLGVKERLDGMGITSQVTHMATIGPHGQEEAKTARIEEKKRIAAVRQRNIALGFQKP